MPEVMLIFRAGFREPQDSPNPAEVTAFGHFQRALPTCPCEKHRQRAAETPAHILHLIGEVFYLERKTSTLLAQLSSSAEQLINHCLKEETIEMLPTWFQRSCWTLPGPFVLANLWHKVLKIARNCKLRVERMLGRSQTSETQSVLRRTNTNHLCAESGPDYFFPQHEAKMIPSTHFHFSREIPIIAYFATVKVRTHL